MLKRLKQVNMLISFQKESEKSRVLATVLLSLKGKASFFKVHRKVFTQSRHGKSKEDFLLRSRTICFSLKLIAEEIRTVVSALKEVAFLLPKGSRVSISLK